MKTLSLPLLIAVITLAGFSASAQYKGPRDYFPKNNPVPGVNPSTPRRAPEQPSPPPAGQPPAAPLQPKFKDVALNSQFYFLSDTNRSYAWTKLSATTAKNSKNGITTTVNAETPVQK